jgi:hypothetical protein
MKKLLFHIIFMGLGGESDNSTKSPNSQLLFFIKMVARKPLCL